MTYLETNAGQGRILLLGSTGQLGATLRPWLANAGEVITTDRSILDFSSAGRIREFVGSCNPAVIVNAVAYTAVDKAESEQELARAVNATAPGVLGQIAAETGALLIHYSTDYVFDGGKTTPYVETDAINPINTY